MSDRDYVSKLEGCFLMFFLGLFGFIMVGMLAGWVVDTLLSIRKRL